jgi:4a-hydroxytetrahydrobiopterin dehydratase
MSGQLVRFVRQIPTPDSGTSTKQTLTRDSRLEEQMPATKERTYNDAEISERLKELPGWYYEDGWIRRVYKTDGWPTTLMLVNAVGYLAEAAYHHPDLTVTWGRITVKLQNHAAGGITDKDFELARKIEDVALWKPQGGALEGTPNKWVRPGDPR